MWSEHGVGGRGLCVFHYCLISLCLTAGHVWSVCGVTGPPAGLVLAQPDYPARYSGASSEAPGGAQPQPQPQFLP